MADERLDRFIRRLVVYLQQHDDRQGANSALADILVNVYEEMTLLESVSEETDG